MEISFIIPLYEAKQRDLNRLLDSIYSQDIPVSDFEVIFVDDCSPSPQETLVNQYIEGNKDARSNLSIIRHKENKRQGGARNTGIIHAKGDYIFFIDQDDWLADGCVKKMLEAISMYPGFDLIMFDSALGNEEGRIINEGHYTAVNSTGPMNGTDFLCRQEVPWTPWHYLYKTKFLTGNGYKFEEQVRFEDKDFVMRCTANARQMIFLTHTAIVHTVSDYEQSAIGDDKNKITDLFKITYRTGKVAYEEYQKGNTRGGDAIMGHHDFSYLSNIKKFLWRLPYSDLKQVITTYPPFLHDKSSGILKFSVRYPSLMSRLLCMSSPALRFTYFLYKKFK